MAGADSDGDAGNVHASQEGCLAQQAALASGPCSRTPSRELATSPSTSLVCDSAWCPPSKQDFNYLMSDAELSWASDSCPD